MEKREKLPRERTRGDQDRMGVYLYRLVVSSRGRPYRIPINLGKVASAQSSGLVLTREKVYFPFMDVYI